MRRRRREVVDAGLYCFWSVAEVGMLFAFIDRHSNARECPICGKTFSGRNPKGVYCSNQCRVDGVKRYTKEYYSRSEVRNRRASKLLQDDLSRLENVLLNLNGDRKEVT